MMTRILEHGVDQQNIDVRNLLGGRPSCCLLQSVWNGWHRAVANASVRNGVGVSDVSFRLALCFIVHNQ